MLTQPKPTRSRYSTMLTQSRLCVLLFLLCLDKIGIEHSLLQPVAGGVSLLGKIFFYLQTGYGGCPTGAVSGIFYINSNGDFGIVLRGKGNKDTVVFAVGILGSAGLTADVDAGNAGQAGGAANFTQDRSEEHTSELQSRPHLVCRLLLEKKKTT